MTLDDLAAAVAANLRREYPETTVSASLAHPEGLQAAKPRLCIARPGFLNFYLDVGAHLQEAGIVATASETLRQCLRQAEVQRTSATELHGAAVGGSCNDES
ncbi:hypothetical protein [Rubellimicrobium arenae]|uniref:hypothetical protein n=1 Tax=Rubellimicrobium arenae TaxID=2817372 RepID=UPI001B30492F|nr:hypothetical protein [Rubellimicrobium arenae]